MTAWLWWRNHHSYSTILGSDITGTIGGNDSLSLAAATLQTSTVYGGAGDDTLLWCRHCIQDDRS